MILSKWIYNGVFALLALIAISGWQAWSLEQFWQLSKLPTSYTAHNVATSPSWISISRFHLFGEYVAQSDLKEQTALSSLNLTVVGIFLAIPSSASTALLDMGEGSSKIYHVGDALQGDVKLYKILKDAVVIAREGHYETIPLDKDTLQFESPADPLPLESND